MHKFWEQTIKTSLLYDAHPGSPQILKPVVDPSPLRLSLNTALRGAADVEQSTTFGRPPRLVLVLSHKRIKFEGGDKLSVLHWAAPRHDHHFASLSQTASGNVANLRDN